MGAVARCLLPARATHSIRASRIRGWISLPSWPGQAVARPLSDVRMGVKSVIRRSCDRQPRRRGASTPGRVEATDWEETKTNQPTLASLAMPLQSMKGERGMIGDGTRRKDGARRRPGITLHLPACTCTAHSSGVSGRCHPGSGQLPRAGRRLWPLLPAHAVPSNVGQVQTEGTTRRSSQVCIQSAGRHAGPQLKSNPSSFGQGCILFSPSPSTAACHARCQAQLTSTWIGTASIASDTTH